MEVREFMWLAKMSAKELSKEMSCSQNSIGKIRRKNCTPSLLTAIKLLDFSNEAITLKDLLSGKDKQDYEIWCCTKRSGNL